jgi:hypothetical protein
MIVEGTEYDDRVAFRMPWDDACDASVAAGRLVDGQQIPTAGAAGHIS